jgi:hypothetical protein
LPVDAQESGGTSEPGLLKMPKHLVDVVRASMQWPANRRAYAHYPGGLRPAEQPFLCIRAHKRPVVSASW